MYVASGAEDSVLDQSLVPYRSAPVYLRLVNTTKRALDYAAAGFHVSVARGLAGGCKDAANAFNGTTMAACAEPLNREDLRSKWTASASAYLDAYRKGAPIASLRAANGVADVAYAAEGVDPPRDPETGTPEPVQAYKAGFPWWMLAIGGAIVAGTVLSKKKRGKARRRRRR